MFPSHRSYAFVGIALLAVVGCGQGEPDPEAVAEHMVDTLRAIPGDKERSALSALALNSMCTIGRLASGEAEGRVEQAVATLFDNQSDSVKGLLTGYHATLGHIPGSVRSELLGDLNAFDPGACDTAPDWERLRDGIVFSHQLIPHLRFNFCSNNLTYGDGTPAERAITAGSLLTAIIPEPDGGTPTHELAPLATPALIGIEKSEFVSARVPGLAATAEDGEGISPYGFRTDIPCSVDNDSCDASLGLICRASRCVAYPVVQKDQTMVLRGYNFWDVSEARVVFEPLVPGEGSESSTIISTLDPNEPTDPVAACGLPSLNAASYNRGHFRVPANEGHFYRVRMFNHNGTFLTQQDGIDHAPSRVIHTCYPPEGPNPDNVPPGTIRDCTAPQESCPQDGATCAATWSTPPRKLEDCRHLPGEPPPCGETPEWYEAMPLSPRADDIAFLDEAVVFVEGEAPVFTLDGALHAMEVREETGLDFPGSDEPLLIIAGSDLDQELPDPDRFAQRFLGEDYDEGERKIEDVALTSVNVPADGSAVFLAMLLEDDGFAAAFAAGVLAIAAAAAIIILSGGLSLVAAAGGAAGVTLLWALLVQQFHEEDDLIGMDSFSASPIEVRERIGATHADDFLTTEPPLFGALPAVPDGASSGVIRSQLIHPFEEFRVSDEPLQAECNPGTCAAGTECQVNRCVPTGFVDPTAGTGFRERREYSGSGGRYAVDLEWRISEE